MGSTKHEKSFVDFEKPYEQNIIGLKGIAYFGIGLFLLIVITFGLMWALMNVLEDQAQETKASTNPMQMSERDRLPPEPRLQSAPGFGVDGPNGPVNLELTEPQSEYRTLHRQWVQQWEHGAQDPRTGTIVSMPIEDAKQRFLSQQVKARTGPEAEKAAVEPRQIVSDASSGRMASERRR